jgi:hypothetical protein
LTTFGRSYFLYASKKAEDGNEEAKKRLLEKADGYCRQALEAVPSEGSGDCSNIER